MPKPAKGFQKLTNKAIYIIKEIIQDDFTDEPIKFKSRDLMLNIIPGFAKFRVKKKLINSIIVEFDLDDEIIQQCKNIPNIISWDQFLHRIDGWLQEDDDKDSEADENDVANNNELDSKFKQLTYENTFIHSQ